MIKRVYNKRVELPLVGVSVQNLEEYLSAHLLSSVLQPNEKVLRHAIVGVNGGNAIIEMVIAETDYPLDRSVAPTYYPAPKRLPKKVIAHIVPTGVRASMGGYIADASPATNLLASVADYVITNPNAVNAAVANYMAPNVLYTEGHSIDNFFAGRLVLRPRTKLNRVGLIIDCAEDYDDIRKYVFQTADMCRIAGGIDIRPYVITDEVVGSRSFANESGAFSGEIGNPGTLLNAMDKLLRNRAHEIDVIAVATQIHIPEDALERYHRGEIPDPHGGMEAVTSHMLSWRSGKIVAHGPLLSKEEIQKLLEMKEVETRAAGEVIGGIGFLGCVFVGLSRAPRIHFLSTDGRETMSQCWINLHDVAVVVAPWNSLGGYPMLVAAKRGIPIIAVRDNTTLLNVSKETLGFGNAVIEVDTYFEAAALAKRIIDGSGYLLSSRETDKLLSEGYALAERTGMALESLARPVIPFEEFAKA